MTPLHETPGYDQRPCRGVEVNVFHPVKGESNNADVDAAKRICAQCPPVVRLACLDFAIAESIDVGVWGGCSARERRDVRRARRQDERGAA